MSQRIDLAIIFLIPLLFSISCKDTEKPSVPITPATVTKKDTIIPTEPKWAVINQENVVAILTDYFNSHPERKIALTTPYGEIKIRLFDDTPLHTANFLMLIERGYFDGTVFTRVIDNFVIQGGTNDTEREEIKRIIIGSYDLPPEIRPNHIHRKGALAMAREYEDNPYELSSAYNFFLVEGQVLNTPQIMAIERQHSTTISEANRSIYTTVGGTPHLDGLHTVFGQVYEGWDALAKMSEIAVDKSDWPLEPHYTEFRILDE